MDDAVDFIVGKILNLLAKPHRLFDSWEDLRQAPGKKPATD
jgi:3-polyprenyl-4-hydroxybenzoate decarboxylase